MGIKSPNIKVITVGYNLSEEQNHIKVIELMPKFYNDKILWIFPVSYSGSREYLNKLKNLLIKTGCSYRLITNFLPDEDMLKLIIGTDIFIHIQTTDSFSSALAEHLFVGNIVLNGKWLKYEELEENEIFYEKVSFTNLEEKISNAIVQFDNLSSLAKKNKEKILKLKSWNENIHHWINYFNSLE